ncbi:MAG: peptide chain release factor-like protein [Deltaproteobacteria bacterium]|nr:MAG: peptide chain release factor-like protein [Deltaproteobacteria bacterium]
MDPQRPEKNPPSAGGEEGTPAQDPFPIEIPERDEDLLAACEVETFRGSGPGGQHRNKTESAVRLRHIPTGIVVTATESRSQYRNRVVALARLRKRLEARNTRPKPRRPTSPPPAAREKRLQAKKHRARRKKERRDIPEV